MELIHKNRPLYSDELRMLKSLRTRLLKTAGSRISFGRFFIPAALGAGFTYMATSISGGFFSFVFGTLAVFSFFFSVFGPYLMYQRKIGYEKTLNELDTIIRNGTVDTCTISATRIALAEEYEDEGDLYIVELEPDSLLYIWDHDYNLKKKFPCLQFEIYETHFAASLGRQIYKLSDRVEPEIIASNAKWNYFKKTGAPAHLQTERKNFDELVAEYRSCA
jgi:hypothetical protein